MKKHDYIKAIFFDLGQTLVNLSDITICMYNSLKKNIPELKLDLNKLVYAWGYGTKDLFMDLREKKFINTKDMHLLVLKKLLKTNHINITNEQAKMMVEDVWKDFITNNKIYPDTIPVLTQLKQLKYKLGLITDCDQDVAEGIIQKHNLIKFFDVKVISSVIKSYKPNTLLFNEAIKSVRCKPNEGIYIGDSEIDIKGAKEIGLITIILNRGEIYNQEIGIKPDYKITNLFELPKIISKLK